MADITCKLGRKELGLHHSLQGKKGEIIEEKIGGKIAKGELKEKPLRTGLGIAGDILKPWCRGAFKLLTSARGGKADLQISEGGSHATEKRTLKRVLRGKSFTTTKEVENSPRERRDA